MAYYCGSGRGRSFLVILSWSMPLGSPNPHPFLDQKGLFLHPFLELASKIHTRFQTSALAFSLWKLYSVLWTITWLPKWNQHIHEASCFVIFLIVFIFTLNVLNHLELKIIWYVPSWFPWKSYPISDHNERNLYPFSEQNGSKTTPFGAPSTHFLFFIIPQNFF